MLLNIEKIKDLKFSEIKILMKKNQEIKNIFSLIVKSM